MKTRQYATVIAASLLLAACNKSLVSDSPNQAIAVFNGETPQISKTLAQLKPQGLPSTQFATNFVRQVYLYYLNREPDFPAAQAYINSLTSGYSKPSEVRDDVLNSPEYKTIKTDTAYVTWLYRRYLNRDADTQGLNANTTALSNGTSRSALRNAFLNSSEMATQVSKFQFVGQNYYSLEGRVPDFGGFWAYYYSQEDNTTSRSQMYDGIINSDEFASKDISGISQARRTDVFDFNAKIIPYLTAPPVNSAVGMTGAWSEIKYWPLDAIHAALLPTGKVLTYGSGEDPRSQNMSDPKHNHNDADLWDPETDSHAQINNMSTEIFCSGAAFDADGRLIIAGGHMGDEQGKKDTNIFDIRNTNQYWQKSQDMYNGRWYPTVTTLPDGRMLTLAGTASKGVINSDTEIFNGSSWTRLASPSPIAFAYYPWMFVAPDGNVFHAGPDVAMHSFNPTTGVWSNVGSRVDNVIRDYGTAVMYKPGKIFLAGGGGGSNQPGVDQPVATAYTIDITSSSSTPVVQRTQNDMVMPRRHLNSTILPNGEVFISGGVSRNTVDSTTTPSTLLTSDERYGVLDAEIWNPDTRQFRTVAPMHTTRAYHSTALLLPDGSILSAGSGRGGGGFTLEHLDAEIYYPPYLYTSSGALATRPVINSSPDSNIALNYGSTFNVTVSGSSNISRVTLVRLSAVTHAFNENQRFNELSFSKSGNTVSAVVPTNANYAPPGNYMLFVIDSNGVPSKAKFIKIG